MQLTYLYSKAKINLFSALVIRVAHRKQDSSVLLLYNHYLQCYSGIKVIVLSINDIQPNALLWNMHKMTRKEFKIGYIGDVGVNMNF